MSNTHAQATYQEFGELLKEATERGLRNSIGDSAARAVLFHIAMEDWDVDELNSKLKGLLGNGAISLELVILSELSTILGEELQLKDQDFVKRVSRAEKTYNHRIGRK